VVEVRVLLVTFPARTVAARLRHDGSKDATDEDFFAMSALGLELDTVIFYADVCKVSFDVRQVVQVKICREDVDVCIAAAFVTCIDKVLYCAADDGEA
jgi:hypothetical protein